MLNPRYGVAGVLKRWVYTVESGDAIATRLLQAAGYVFSIVPEHAVLIGRRHPVGGGMSGG